MCDNLVRAQKLQDPLTSSFYEDANAFLRKYSFIISDIFIIKIIMLFTAFVWSAFDNLRLFGIIGEGIRITDIYIYIDMFIQ